MTIKLPKDDPQRERLHNEVHARPVGSIQQPAVTFCLAVLNKDHGVADELTHLAKIDPAVLDSQQASANFLRLALPWGSLRWERHTEFTRYTFVHPFDAADLLSDKDPITTRLARIRERTDAFLEAQSAWISQVPGQTLSAVEVVVLGVTSVIDAAESNYAAGCEWFGHETVFASLLGNRQHTLGMTDFKVNADGVERFLVMTRPQTRPSRVGRTAQRLMEMEIYRMMALRGLPVAKQLSAELGDAERALASITHDVESQSIGDHELLDQLAKLAAAVERANATHNYRFSATRAYDEIFAQRVNELRESPVPGIQTLGEFMQRRLSPAIATVAATSQRLASLSERISRTGNLLRTRVDIATEQQNQQLLEKLTKGQALQLRLQQTVEGLSIAAISYYVVSLIHYLAKAAKGLSWVPLSAETITGISIVPVVLGVWVLTRRVHRLIRKD